MYSIEIEVDCDKTESRALLFIRRKNCWRGKNTLQVHVKNSQKNIQLIVSSHCCNWFQKIYFNDKDALSENKTT